MLLLTYLLLFEDQEKMYSRMGVESCKSRINRSGDGAACKVKRKRTSVTELGGFTQAPQAIFPFELRNTPCVKIGFPMARQSWLCYDDSSFPVTLIT
jgi:hypothetical protein